MLRMESKNREYHNDDITVFWKPGKCIHAAVCYQKLIEVFNPIKRPWVNMEGATTEKIIEIVNQCPTEALMWQWNEEEKNENIDKKETNHIRIRRPWEFKGEENPDKSEPMAEPAKLRIMKDGPLVIQGDFRVVDGDGNQVKTGNLTSLCRCGQSNNMPFCDGMHRKTGFEG